MGITTSCRNVEFGMTVGGVIYYYYVRLFSMLRESVVTTA